MSNTPGNDAPYVTGSISNAATASYPGYAIINTPSGFAGSAFNPVVTLDDGSFLIAYRITAPSYVHNFTIPAGVSGTLLLGGSGGLASEYNFGSITAASPGSLHFYITGRDNANNAVSIELTPVNGKIIITEAVLANFAPNTSQALSVTGIAANSFVSGQQIVDMTRFYDEAAPTTLLQTVGVPSSIVSPIGSVILAATGGLTESFTLQNTASWLGASPTFRLVITTQEPIDLSGLSIASIGQNNVVTGLNFQSVITVTATNGVVSVPHTILEQLQSHPGTVALSISGAIGGQLAQAQATVELPVTTVTEGLYLQHFDASGNPMADAVRVDSAAAPLLPQTNGDEVSHFNVAKAADGTLVASWVGDGDKDGTPDTLYVRHLDASGNPLGAATALSGLGADALAAIKADIGVPSVAGLADGGYAVAYNVGLDTFTVIANATVPGAGLAAGTVTFGAPFGQLDHFQLNQFSPGSGQVTAIVAGETSSGTTQTVTVTLVNGGFTLTDAQRALFAPDAHLSVSISGLLGNTPVSAVVTTRDIFDFSPSSSVTTLSRSGNAGNLPGANPDISFTSGLGQTTSYHITSTLTPGVVGGVTETIGYRMTLVSEIPIDTTGLTLVAGTTANVSVAGIYQTVIVVSAVNGTIDVPASVLAQFPGDGLRTVLGISGLSNGSPVSADLTVRHPSIAQPGIYTQTFDSAGVSEGAAQRIDDPDAHMATSAPAADNPSVSVTPNADGGFNVSWLADTNGDGGTDLIVNRTFDATGAATGTSLGINPAAIPGIVTALAAGADIKAPDEFHLVQLGSGGYAALVQVDVPNVLGGTMSTFVTGGAVFIASPQGRLDGAFINLATASAGGIHYYLTGADAAGANHDVEVFPVDGRITIPASLASQFAPDSRLAIRVEGLQPGSTFQASYNGSEIWNFAPASTISTIHSDIPVTAGVASVASSLLGEVTAFHITNAVAAPGQTPNYLLVISSSSPLNMAGIGLPAQTLDQTSGSWRAIIAVNPDSSGNIAVPPSLLSITESAGASIALAVLNLNGGSTLSVDTTVRHPVSTVTEGLYVQLFDSAGVATGNMIRVDDAASQAIYPIDFAQASIQGDGHGGFVVAWKADADNDAQTDALVIRHFDQNGAASGAATSLTSIPDRIYSEGAAVTLYTSGIFADPDPGDTPTFSASNLPIGLTIDAATGVIHGSAEQSGLFDVTVTATDSGGLSASSTFQVFIINVDNDAPTTAAAAESNGGPVDQDVSGTLLPGFDLDGDALTFVAGAATHGSVSIDPQTGAYTFTPDTGYVGEASFTYQVNDGAQSSAAKTVTITLSANTPPTAVNFANAVSSTPENGGQVKVADVFVSDDGKGTNNLSLSGADAGHFTLIGNALYFTGGGNYEGQNAFDVTVSATDPEFPGAPASQTFHLSLSDVNEAPTALALANAVSSTPENGGSVKVADIVVTDDALGANAVTLTGADAARFSVVGNALYFDGGNFELQSAFDVTVTVTDPAFPGEPLSQSLHLSLTDVNEGPSAVVLSNTVTSTAENGGSIKVADIAVTDDALGTNGLSLSGADSGSFSIVGNALYFNGSGNFESQAAYDVTVVATDAALGASASQAFHLSLTDVNEAPTALSFANSVTVTAENGAQVKVADIVVSDDALGTNGLSLSGTDAAKFTLIGTSLYYIGGGDFEGQNAFDVTVSARDASLADPAVSQSFHLALSDVAEAKSYGGIAQADSLAINPLSIDNWSVDAKSGNDTITTGNGNDLLDGGAGNDALTAGGGNDTLLGGAGSDTLQGGLGDDRITGGTGGDLMYGGLGSDTFVFTLITDSVVGVQADQIGDFDPLMDYIDLTAIDANTKIKADQAFTWIGTAAFTGAAGDLRYDVTGGSVHLFGDTNGDKKADFEIVLNGVTALPAGHDFILL